MRNFLAAVLIDLDTGSIELSKNTLLFLVSCANIHIMNQVSLKICKANNKSNLLHIFDPMIQESFLKRYPNF